MKPYDHVEETGCVLDVQRLSVHDGPGIRTTVFLKGCPLQCIWCHNPESWLFEAELMYSEENCMHCARCVPTCPQGCHQLKFGRHTFNRTKCTACAACVQPGCKALQMEGQRLSAAQVIEVIMKDSAYYKNAGGGITISGGEPLAQPAFTLALLRAAKGNLLHTCVETSGYGDVGALQAMADICDLFLYDWKQTDDRLHKLYTGQSNQTILENLFMLDKLGARLILRCPVIPGYNNTKEHFDGIVNIAQDMLSIREIQLLPYHRLGEDKNRHLQRPYQDIALPRGAEMQKWKQYLSSRLSIPVTCAGNT